MAEANDEEPPAKQARVSAPADEAAAAPESANIIVQFRADNGDLSGVELIKLNLSVRHLRI